jgi:hypothetical protein
MALTYSIARQFTRQTKTGAGSTNYSDVSGVSISNTFFENGKTLPPLRSADARRGQHQHHREGEAGARRDAVSTTASSSTSRTS